MGGWFGRFLGGELCYAPREREVILIEEACGGFSIESFVISGVGLEVYGRNIILL